MERYHHKDFVADLHRQAKEQGYTGEAVERMLHERGESIREDRESGEAAADVFNHHQRSNK